MNTDETDETDVTEIQNLFVVVNEVILKGRQI